MAKRTISGIYENGAIRFHTTMKLGRKLPLRNHTRLRFIVELPMRHNVVGDTFGLLRVPKHLARLVAESPEFSVLNT